MPYQPIESYGIVGDMYSVALVNRNGSIDWCCLPHFDSPSIFAAILDDNKGGRFKIAPEVDTKNRQMYLPDTNVLVTRFHVPEGVGEITDFMPIHRQTMGLTVPLTHQIVRIVRAVRGNVTFKLNCNPAFDYGRKKHRVVPGTGGVVFTSKDMRLALVSPVKLEVKGSAVEAEFTLEEGETFTFILRTFEKQRSDDYDLLQPHLIGNEALNRTVQYWKKWISQCNYQGRWREMVYRSALALKLMTFEPTGAIVASPTMSLPEDIGGERNWDYRYTWIRDAAFTVYAFLRLGFKNEARKFMGFLEQRALEGDENGPLQVMYRINGSHELPEETLPHLEGYRQSGPVRVGNGAAKQLQLDIYGELMDAVYLYNKYAEPISYDFWQHMRQIMSFVADNYDKPDEGIWETRGGRQHFVYSKMQCWIAMDRGMRLSSNRGLPIDRDRIRAIKDKLYDEIMEKGWDARRQTFVQAYGSDRLDASNLLMPLVRFISSTDPRMQSTLNAIMETLVSDSLVYRYELNEAEKVNHDGLSGGEGTFSMCTFWLAEALCKAGRVDEGRLIFEKMLTYASHLGLYSEEIGPLGEALGNFPQAFTHLGLISAALELDRALGAGE